MTNFLMSFLFLFATFFLLEALATPSVSSELEELYWSVSNVVGVEHGIEAEGVWHRWGWLFLGLLAFALALGLAFLLATDDAFLTARACLLASALTP